MTTRKELHANPEYKRQVEALRRLSLLQKAIVTPKPKLRQLHDGLWQCWTSRHYALGASAEEAYRRLAGVFKEIFWGNYGHRL